MGLGPALGPARHARDRVLPPRRALRHRPAADRDRPRADPAAIAQIESPEAVEAVEEIAAIDGVDVLFVGPSDLSYSMGMFREFDRPEFRGAIERVNEAARAAGKATGIFLTDVAQVPAAIADGFQMIALGTDGSFMMKAAGETLARARGLQEE